MSLFTNIVRPPSSKMTYICSPAVKGRSWLIDVWQRL